MVICRHFVCRKLRRRMFLAACIILFGYIRSLVVTINFIEDYTKRIEYALVKMDTVKVPYTNDQYIVVPNVIYPRVDGTGSGNNEIIICTQTSLNNLYNIITLSKMWDGHISVAVFSYGDEISQALYYILLMQKCSEDIQLKTSFHLVYPTTIPPTKIKSIYQMNYSCDNLLSIRQKYSWDNYALKNIQYPVNILRNVALMHSNSAYVLNLDIDICPSKGMKKDMEAFLMKADKYKKIAYILPCFETSVPLYASVSKYELISAVTNSSMRQYSVRVCPNCHRATNYSRWMDLSYPSEMNSSYYVAFQMPYEPYYIAARQHLPLFYDKFKQFGRNRVSQMCEAYYSGYEFTVMNNAFLVHNGLKKGSIPDKKKQMKLNGYIYKRSFLSDLRTKYPQSNRSC